MFALHHNLHHHTYSKFQCIRLEQNLRNILLSMDFPCQNNMVRMAVDLSAIHLAEKMCIPLGIQHSKTTMD